MLKESVLLTNTMTLAELPVFVSFWRAEIKSSEILNAFVLLRQTHQCRDAIFIKIMFKWRPNGCFLPASPHRPAGFWSLCLRGLTARLFLCSAVRGSGRIQAEKTGVLPRLWIFHWCRTTWESLKFEVALRSESAVICFIRG